MPVLTWLAPNLGVLPAVETGGKNNAEAADLVSAYVAEVSGPLMLYTCKPPLSSV